MLLRLLENHVIILLNSLCSSSKRIFASFAEKWSTFLIAFFIQLNRSISWRWFWSWIIQRFLSIPLYCRIKHRMFKLFLVNLALSYEIFTRFGKRTHFWLFNLFFKPILALLLNCLFFVIIENLYSGKITTSQNWSKFYLLTPWISIKLLSSWIMNLSTWTSK